MQGDVESLPAVNICLAQGFPKSLPLGRNQGIWQHGACFCIMKAPIKRFLMTFRHFMSIIT